MMRIAALAGGILFLFTWGLIGVTSGSQSISHAIMAEPGDGGVPVREQEVLVKGKATANLMVEDMAATITFYHDILGFEVAMNAPQEPPYDWVQLSRDGAEIMFQTRASMGGEVPELKDTPIGGSFGLYIEVSDVRALYQRCAGKVKIVKDLRKSFYGMLEFSILDNNGYLLGFASPATE